MPFEATYTCTTHIREYPHPRPDILAPFRLFDHRRKIFEVIVDEVIVDELMKYYPECHCMNCGNDDSRLKTAISLNCSLLFT